MDPVTLDLEGMEKPLREWKDSEERVAGQSKRERGPD